MAIHTWGGVCPGPGRLPRWKQELSSKTVVSQAGKGGLVSPNYKVGQIILGYLGKYIDLHCTCEVRTLSRTPLIVAGIIAMNEMQFVAIIE